MRGFYYKGTYCIASNKPMLVGKLLDISIMRPDIEKERIEYAEQDNAAKTAFQVMLQKYKSAESDEVREEYIKQAQEIMNNRPKPLRKFTPKTLKFRVVGNGDGYVKLELVSKWPKNWPLPEDTFKSEEG